MDKNISAKLQKKLKKIDEIFKLTIPSISFSLKKVNPDLDEGYLLLDKVFLNDDYLKNKYSVVFNKNNFNNVAALFKRESVASLVEAREKVEKAFGEIKKFIPKRVKVDNITNLKKYIHLEQIELESFGTIIFLILITSLLVLSALLYITLKIIFSKKKADSESIEILKKKKDELKKKLSFLPVNNSIMNFFITTIAMFILWINAEDADSLQYMLGKLSLILIAIVLICLILLNLLGLTIWAII